MIICLEPIQFVALLHLQHRTVCASKTANPCAEIALRQIDPFRRPG
jgi:hypothetical protein